MRRPTPYSEWRRSRPFLKKANVGLVHFQARIRGVTRVVVSGSFTGEGCGPARAFRNVFSWEIASKTGCSRSAFPVPVIRHQHPQRCHQDPLSPLHADRPATPALTHRPFADRALKPCDVPDATMQLPAGLPRPPRASSVLQMRRGDAPALPSGVAPTRRYYADLSMGMMAPRAGPLQAQCEASPSHKLWRTPVNCTNCVT